MRGSRLGQSFVVVLAAVASLHGLALAQSLGGPVDVQLFRPAIDSKGFITVNASQVLEPQKLSFGLVGNYARDPLVLEGTPGTSTPGNEEFSVRHLVTTQFQVAYGLFKNFEIGAAVPLTVVEGRHTPALPAQAGMPNTGDALTFGAQGIGDIVFYPKYRILNTSLSPIGLAASLGVVLPTGDKTAFTGEGQVELLPSLILDKFTLGERFHFGLNVGGRIRTKTVTFTDNYNLAPFCTMPGMMNCATPTGKSITVGSEAMAGAAMAVGLVPQRLELVTEIYGSAGFHNGIQELPVEALAGFKLYLAHNSFMDVGAGLGIDSHALHSSDSAYGAPDFRVFLGLVWEPTVGDRDGDGIKDDIDQCPDDPEDPDGFEDQDGCPDPDNDQDGIPDKVDKCPMDPENKNGFEDADGCPDSPVLDRDGDGIPDDVDKCPDDPEDKDGFEDQDGCPDPDNDKDGIPDTSDLCPNQPEDKDGFEDQDGCPDPDNDKDGIPDTSDKCPNEPETFNGYEDEDGCPDRGRVIVHKGKIEILDKIYFETDKAIIKPESFPILDAIAATLQGNPQIEQVEIQGHADERGSPEHNMELTQARAESVMQYLVNKGIDPARLTAKGYGATMPIDPGHDEEAWSKNRRVEFVILKRSDEGGVVGPASAPSAPASSPTAPW
jgi:outer membrane protein OmpA-like peptidoglycan-associated protein